MNNEGNQKMLADFAHKCHGVNLRVTPQRVAVYQELVKSKAHPSANMVYQKVRKKFPHISLDTVNRTLLTLAEVGLASVLAGSGDGKRFDGGLETHQHFRCIKCNKIIDFNCRGLENIKLPAAIRENFTILAKTVYLEGICSYCKKRNRD